MCGIIGYTGPRQAIGILLKGLENLEYRGYDSAGVSILNNVGGIRTFRSPGKLENLRNLISAEGENSSQEGSSGVGHTRWATHGAPTEQNAHPHSDCTGDLIIAHNGIVENFSEIKGALEKSGHVFTSETDSETISHLIESLLLETKSIDEAVRNAAMRIKGANAIVVISKSEPGKILAVRIGNAGGITIGYGEGEMYVASDLPALIEHTTNLAHLNDGEIAIIEKDTAKFTDLSGKVIPKTPGKVDYDPVSITKGDYQHFMLKEINEQPEAVVSSLRERISFNSGNVSLEGFPLSTYEIRALKRVVMVGMGTSLHAAMVGRHWIERIANIPTEWDNSSEFRYRNPIIDEETLFITVSQSGETADTLAAMSEANRKGARQITLCNYPGTQSSRLADGTIQIKAGLEIGVAATKTFICSLTTLYMLAIHLGMKRDVLNSRNASGLIQELLLLPDLLGETLQRDPQIQELVQEFHQSSNFLFLGRGINYPIAMEGALKLKEISYIHAEGYPAGEMKHGPISLIDETIPIVALVPLDSLHEKMLSNISEAKARGGKVIAIASEGDDLISTKADHVVRIPNGTENMNPFLLTLPLQTLAYHMGVKRGCNVDQPRNLAKSVTVE